MSGSHGAPPPEERTCYDLRTVPEREAEALAQLELRLDNLLDVVERQARRIRALEVENAALRADLERHAETVRLTTGPADVALDVVEMFCDWKAATERHADGNLERSIEINRERFKMSDQLVAIFQNTRAWIEADPIVDRFTNMRQSDVERMRKELKYSALYGAVKCAPGDGDA